MLDIYKVSLKVAPTVGVAGERIVVHDKDLARQMRRSMASVILNIAEGSGCAGGTRRQRYRDALGSANETLAALELAEALGYVTLSDDVRDQFGHIIGVLTVCAYPRRTG